MVLNIQFNASYLPESRAMSRVTHHFVLRSKPVNGELVKMKGAVYVFCGSLIFAAASAAKAELEALFLNSKEGKILCITLHKFSHKQPPTPMYCNNVTARRITSNTINKQRSRSIEKKYVFGSQIKSS